MSQINISKDRRTQVREVLGRKVTKGFHEVGRRVSTHPSREDCELVQYEGGNWSDTPNMKVMAKELQAGNVVRHGTREITPSLLIFSRGMTFYERVAAPLSEGKLIKEVRGRVPPEGKDFVKKLEAITEKYEPQDIDQLLADAEKVFQEGAPS
jgi:hypothetical protein